MKKRTVLKFIIENFYCYDNEIKRIEIYRNLKKSLSKEVIKHISKFMFAINKRIKQGWGYNLSFEEYNKFIENNKIEIKKCIN